MDHTDIRGLGTALHQSVAGLPRSSVGDHHEGCPHSRAEDSPHRVRASRCRSGVSGDYVMELLRVKSGGRLGIGDDLSADIPEEGGQFAREGDADLVVVQASSFQAAITVVQPHLCTPGDRADWRRLSVLTRLQL
jgi:hypothetical protein